MQLLSFAIYFKIDLISKFKISYCDTKQYIFSADEQVTDHGG